jgi:protein-disulfide isomerase
VGSNRSAAKKSQAKTRRKPAPPSQRYAKSDRRWLLIVPVAVAVAVVIGLVAISRSGSSKSTPAAAADLAGVSQVNDLLSGIPSNGDTIGDPAAKVAIVEYGDLRCPVCAQFSQQELPTVVSDLVRSGKAKLQLRLWPITQPQSDSVSANLAGAAAASQNQLWRFAELWWANQGDETTSYATPAYIHTIAAGAGLNQSKLDSDRSSQAATDSLNATDAAAQKLGLTGTPSIVVIGPGGQKSFTDTVPSASQIAQAVQAVQA